MEANQDVIMADSRNMIIKRKRTKRPRPSSPLTLTMASTSSTTTTTISEDGDTENNHNNTFHDSIELTKLIQENEEEDMVANCLILLAQGQSFQPSHKSGLFVYECKTCNRGFSSFQALGGHKASHKKPSKQNLEDNNFLNMVTVDRHNSTKLSLQIGSSLMMTQCNPSGSFKVSKIHECSICGTEFGSGQALGGHMRRHRSMPLARTICSDSNGCQESKKPKTLLSLDLNLPAPVDNDLKETKFPFGSKDQMIEFSNSSLVHCDI